MPEMQKDLVLSINEYAYVLDRTKGNVSCWVGPAKTSLSTSDEMVVFDEASKSFVPARNYNEATKLFTTAPENWYVILKNPTENNSHPRPGTANNLPDNIQIGRKINIRGPVSFPLYPGQMAKVIRGHALRTNQYLLARVYEAAAASQSQGEMLDAEGNKIETVNNYVNGQILVIKGTEVSFYIPPTGIEVIPVSNDYRKGYVREAVTLERLEYCILKDEDGNKRYVHGPEVVFPEPTETFVTSPKGGYVFRAMELSPISGLYVKVIAEYTDDKNVVHPVGEEMFITGHDQMIYYPRPEHAIINYDGKLMHHAIAIPEGEGRYVMNRLTGEIRTVRGPAMYLPDPRTEVIVKRKLSEKQCNLWFPGNVDALAYNLALTEKAVEKSTAKSTATTANYMAATDWAFSTADTATTLANLEAKANISRGTSYTKPRTITLETKFEGVVAIDIWTGYAVNVISKNGERRVVCGPQTILLDYDQTLEVLTMSTGKPKTTDNCIQSVYLRHENNKVSDIINVETKDFVRCAVKVSYCVDFDKKAMDKWFNVDNYVKFMCDRVRSEVKRVVKNYTIEEFYNNYSTIVHDVAVCADVDLADGAKFMGRYFPENGMYIHDCEVLSISVENEIAKMLTAHQQEMVQKSLELSDAEKRVKVATALAEAEKKEQELRSQQLLNKMALQREEAIRKQEIQSEINRKQEAEKLAAKQAEQDMQVIIDALHEAKLARDVKNGEFELSVKKAEADLEMAKQNAYTANVEKIMASIAPELIAAMTSTSNAQLMETVAKAMSPVAMARGESVAETTNLLLRGTPLEGIIKDAVKKSAE